MPPGHWSSRQSLRGAELRLELRRCFRCCPGLDELPEPPPEPTLALDQPVRYRVWPRAILDAQCPVDHVVLSPSSIDGSDPLHPAGTCSWTRASPALRLYARERRSPRGRSANVQGNIDRLAVELDAQRPVQTALGKKGRTSRRDQGIALALEGHFLLADREGSGTGCRCIRIGHVLEEIKSGLAAGWLFARRNLLLDHLNVALAAGQFDKIASVGRRRSRVGCEGALSAPGEHGGEKEASSASYPDHG